MRRVAPLRVPVGVDGGLRVLRVLQVTGPELFSLLMRISTLMFLCSTTALLSWWHLYGPAWALVGAIVTLLFSIFVDLVRFSE